MDRPGLLADHLEVDHWPSHAVSSRVQLHKRRSYYSELFGWEFASPIGPTDYTLIERHTNAGA